MFVDRVRIFVKAGDGGDGCVAFRREKFVPRGGPSGGDGGDGGSVAVCGNSHLNTLLNFRYRQHFRAGRGAHGSGSNRHGKHGENLILEVPLGTQISDSETGELLCDITRDGQAVELARGGKGGRGNAAFATSVNQAPRRFEAGQVGEERALTLELKVLADIGLIGFPNAGKSTLISVISAARPKIADYPFTTLSPHLGVVSFDSFETVVVADIPGLIEGAHAGSGLGDQFLRHVERCRILIHLVDVSPLGEDDPVEAMGKINRELELYSPALVAKPQLVVATKTDVADEIRLAMLKLHCRNCALRFFEVSAVEGTGVQALKSGMMRLLKEGAD